MSSSFATLPMAHSTPVTLVSLLCLELPNTSCLRVFVLFFSSMAAIPPISNSSPLFRLYSNITLSEMCTMTIPCKIASLLYLVNPITCYLHVCLYLHNIYYLTLHFILICWFASCPKYTLLESRDFISFVYGCIPSWHKVVAH